MCVLTTWLVVSWWLTLVLYHHLTSINWNKRGLSSSVRWIEIIQRWGWDDSTDPDSESMIRRKQKYTPTSITKFFLLFPCYILFLGLQWLTELLSLPRGWSENTSIITIIFIMFGLQIIHPLDFSELLEKIGLKSKLNCLRKAIVILS